VSDAQTASVTASGLATGLKAGSSFVRASSEGITGGATLNIDPIPDDLEKVSGDQQMGTLRQILPEPITVEARDANGNPIVGKVVTFGVVVGGGSVSPVQAQTGADGRASTTWQLGCSNDNPQLLQAGIGNLTASFEASVDLTALAICQASVPGGRETLPYSADLVAAGGDQASLGWSVVGGALPPGLNLQGSGELTGTPNLRGDYQFTAQVDDALGASASAQFDLKVCGGPVTLAPGQAQVFSPDGPDGCGFFLPSGDNGDRYRFGVVYTESEADSSDVPSVQVKMSREAGGAVVPPLGPPGISSAAAAFRAGASPRRTFALKEDLGRAESRARFHRELRRAEQELIRSLGPNARPLPDTRGPNRVSGPLRASPAKRSFVNPASFDSQGGCTVGETVRAVLIKENDHVAIYQDSVQWASDRMSDDHAQKMLDFYAAGGKQVIDTYFGGVTDVNGDQRVVVFVSPVVGEELVAFVWSLDFFPKVDEIRDGVSWEGCAASNAMEMMRFNHDIIKRIATGGFQALGAAVHEAKHISSVYKSLFRGDFQPLWVEEGTAEIAEETAARIAWAGAGGPAVGAMVDGDDLADWTEENYAAVSVNASTVRYLSSQPNGVVVTPLGAAPGHSVYGSGWHFHRWLGDAYGNASTAGADAPFFQVLNDSVTAAGAQGVLAVTGAPSWADLLQEYLTAVMLNGTGAPQGPKAITSYEFTTTTEIFSNPNPAGSYPWAVNAIVGAGDLSGPAPFLADNDGGPLGPSGFRIYDLRSDGTGLGLAVVVTAGPASSPFRIVLVRVE
ncbi:MAG: Ig domain-containing protein, partial [Gemmatimonadetes bacterium]|nr:Ig domain-containing protein [Gemmatimonadota bacterium]